MLQVQPPALSEQTDEKTTIRRETLCSLILVHLSNTTVIPESEATTVLALVEKKVI